jgi:cation transport regulator ChaB
MDFSMAVRAWTLVRYANGFVEIAFRLSAKTMFAVTSPSRDCHVQLVPPGTWPGVACAVTLSGPTWRHGRRRRIVLRIGLAGAAGAQYLHGSLASQHSRAGHFLQFGNTAGMVHVLVRIEDEFNICDVKTQLADMAGNLYRRLFGSAVDQNVPGVRRDQHGTDAVRAHVIRVAIDSKRFLGRVPVGSARRLYAGQQDGRTK